MKELNICANVCALTVALPTEFGSLFMHFSQLSHTRSIAGTLLSLSHLFSTYSLAHTAISASVSAATSSDALSTSERIVDQKE